MSETDNQALQFDCIIVGAGQSGAPLAQAFANAGRKTALIERKHIGGTCVSEGCIPSTTMAAAAEIAALAKRAYEMGILTGHIRADIEKVRQRKRDVMESFMTSLTQDVSVSKNLTLIFGHAHFTGMNQLEVLVADGETQTLTAPTILLDTGCRPLLPPIPGMERVAAYDSTSIMEIDHIPEHLIVLGGGYIGVEFSQMFRRFGSRVTLLQQHSQLLENEDKEMARAVAELLREDGIRVLLGSEAIQLEKGSESIRVTISSSGLEMPMEGTDVLMAMGRIPNTDGLDVEETGLQLDEHGFVPVNDRLETCVPGIFAAGDITGGPAFTHTAYDDYRVLRTNLVDAGQASTAERLTPRVVFIDPQYACVGLTEDEARERGMEVKVVRLNMTSVPRAIETNRTRGFMKAIVDSGSGRIQGFACLASNGGELMAIVQTAMMGKLPYTALRDAVFARPTLAESLNMLFATLH